MTTAIPPSVFDQITQTNLSPETTVALLNAAESSFSSTPKHLNQKRVYPFWKTCLVCSKPYPCQTKEQVSRNMTCGPACASRKMAAAPRKPRPITYLQEVACSVCGNVTRKRRDRSPASPTCSRQCNGVLRGQDWAKHAHKSAAARTPAGLASYRQKMSGPNNPAWNGGVTYFRKHGNYPAIKHVRCPAELLSMARQDGYVMEHRLFVAQAMGRPLLRSEVVHHKDHDPANNALSNLQLFASNSDHKKYEAKGIPAPIWSL